jgi:hypothetical protein
MSLKYSVEVSYKLDNELKITQLEIISKYMELIKENKEIVEKDTILNNLGMKYHTDMNSHDFDIAVSNLFTPGRVLQRNTNFELNKLNIINFIKEIPNNYSIQFINKKVSNNISRIYDINDKTTYKTLTDLDNQIISIVKNINDKNINDKNVNVNHNNK